MKSYLTLTVIFILSAGCGGGGSSPNKGPGSTSFANPEQVTIMGYAGDIMEPYFSRDGVYLFFNDSGNTKDIYYAAYVDDLTFQFQGAITAINTIGAVEGAPTMDDSNNFYYVGTANYNPPTTYDTLYTGTWNGTSVTGSTPLTGLAITTPGAINFDLEISPDGTTLYFNDGIFSSNGFPDSDALSIANNTSSGFVRDPNSAIIMANINTADLEYAPAISANGLEFFFTRLELATLSARIYHSVRSSTSEPFGTPTVISDITNFSEGPTLSPDEKSLYYHKMNDMTGGFELFRVTRP